MNTRIIYKYRDASNYSFIEEVVVEGAVSLDQITPLLEEGEKFIVHQISEAWPDPHQQAADAFEYPTEDDHVYCEVAEVEPTADPRTVDTTADDLLHRLRQIGNQWDIVEAMTHLGL